MTYNIIATGVGGQGVLFLSRILGEVALRQGFYPTIGEVHGMSQRGGTVVATVRIGDMKGLGPLIKQGGADALIAMEPLEAARAWDMLSEDAVAVVNTRPIWIEGYPEVKDLIGSIEKRCQVISYDAFEIARRVGAERSQNMVLLGTLIGSGRTPVEEKYVRDVLGERGGGKNLRCFEEGLHI